MGSSSDSLGIIHGQLLNYAERLEALASGCGQPAERASAVILQEDLDCLIEECEELLICGLEAGSKEAVSFQLRSVTVIEEVDCFLSSIIAAMRYGGSWHSNHAPP